MVEKRWINQKKESLTSSAISLLTTPNARQNQALQFFEGF